MLKNIKNMQRLGKFEPIRASLHFHLGVPCIMEGSLADALLPQIQIKGMVVGKCWKCVGGFYVNGSWIKAE